MFIKNEDFNDQYFSVFYNYGIDIQFKKNIKRYYIVLANYKGRSFMKIKRYFSSLFFWAYKHCLLF